MKQLARKFQVTIIALFGLAGIVVAQDFLLSQPWSASTVIAPSFAGIPAGVG